MTNVLNGLSLNLFRSSDNPEESKCPADHLRICQSHLPGQNLSDHPESFKIYLSGEEFAKCENEDNQRPVIHI